jgi:hypothetical protein
MKIVKTKVLFTILVLFLSTLNFTANANNFNEQVSITGSLLIPSYSSNEKDYAIKNCHKKIKTVNIITGKSKKQKNTYFVENKKYPFKVGNTTIFIKCLPDIFSSIDYKFNNYKSSSRDLILITEVFGPVVYTNKGYPLWYNQKLGAGYGLSTLDENGIITVLKSNMRIPSNGRGFSAMIYKYDLVNNRYLEKIIPFEKVEGEIRQPLIDYHGFAEVEDGYYLISYNDTVTNSNYLDKFKDFYLDNNSSSGIESDRREMEICKKEGKIVIREPKIIKVNKTGRVVWSHIIKQSNFEKPTLEILENKESSYSCYLDLNHPNWISVDKNEENMIVSLRNHYIASYNIKDKKLNFTLGHISPEVMKTNNIDKALNLEIINDPQKGSCNTHSGSINEKNELILFDNRCIASESSRALIYKIDKSNKTATFVKQYYPEKKCNLITDNSSISCNTINMGNASFTHFDGVVVNWGERNGGKEIMSVYDGKDKKIFDLSYNKITDIIYKSYYFKEDFFKVKL